MKTLIGYDPLQNSYLESSKIKSKKIKTEISNILKSYAGYYDAFSELLQNAMDALDKREKVRQIIIEALQKENIEDLTTEYQEFIKEELINELDTEINFLDMTNTGLINKLNEITYEKTIWITVNLKDNYISVTDNGVAFKAEEFQNFLSPNITFKNGDTEQRGNKGVGATFLAYGYDYLQVGTKTHRYKQLLELTNGKSWVNGNIQETPVFNETQLIDKNFNEISRGSTFTLKFGASKSKPKNLKWIGAETYEQWKAILLLKTPLGKIDIENNTKSDIKFYLKVITSDDMVLNNDGKSEIAKYIYPHECISFIPNVDIIEEDLERSGRNNYKNQKGIHKFYNKEFLENLLKESYGKRISRIKSSKAKVERNIQLYENKPEKDKILVKSIQNYKNNKKELENLKDEENELNSSLDKNILLLNEFGMNAYGAFFYSKEAFREYNNNVLKLRKGTKILSNGLHLSTNHMLQGDPISIQLKFETGYENQVHIVFHVTNTEPDLGRKGFQPEVTELAKELSELIVNHLKKYKKAHLMPNPNKKKKDKDKLTLWKEQGRQWEENNPLYLDEHVDSKYFAGTAGIPLLTTPKCEQDVIVLFNQLLGSGIIRGVKLLLTNQNTQYDGLFRYYNPYLDYAEFSLEENPLGIISENDSYQEEKQSVEIFVLEYKYNMDRLIEEIGSNDKNETHIQLAVVWDMGEDCYTKYNVINTLIPPSEIENEELREKLRHREYHGITHVFYEDDDCEKEVFKVICIKELIEYINSLEAESEEVE